MHRSVAVSVKPRLSCHSIKIVMDFIRNFQWGYLQVEFRFQIMRGAFQACVFNVTRPKENEMTIEN